MSNSPNPEDAGRQDLDSIAQELLGIDTTGGFDDVLDLDDDDLPPIESSEPVETEAVESPHVEAAAESGGSQDDLGPTASDDEFGGGLGLFDEAAEVEEEEHEQPAVPPPPAPVPVAAASAAEPVSTPPEPEPAPAAAPSVSNEESDDYWDALDGWDWDESEPAGKEAEAETPSRVQPETAGDVAPVRASVKVEEFIEDDEFGAGLEEGSERTPERETARGRRRDEEQRESAGGRGRRRRGRKSREKRADIAVEPANVIDSNLTDEEEVEADQNFGAGLDVGKEASEEAPSQRRRRSRGRRRRDSGDRPTGSVQDTERLADIPDELDVEDESEIEESEPRNQDKYRNVPTWEEAISCLVQVKRRSGGSSERSSRKDGHRSEGSGRPRRRGGGRGRGRRRSSE